ncbi:NAD(P)-dependent oxidoreductase [Paracoccus sp. SM22M-07]|uniref:NAD(P)-dependent oxidoreductase n=1 Tax=Paracoccus sp. SM22M-07 TaxID=1520813 RepID=UPI00147AE132|nr:NAD(P)H-binding protein [Paracoccus sp. SM22M-07]
MRIVVVGANGSVGQEIVTQALAAGHNVVGAVRRPETLSHIKGVEVAKIDLSNPETLTIAMQGADAVISALGHGGLGSSMKFTTLYSDATRAIRQAMRQTGVKRIMVLSSGGTVDNPNAPAFYSKFLRRLLINTYTDMARMEAILEESGDLDWTVVRLTYLLKGPSKPFLVEEGKLSRGNFKIHTCDAARFVVGELNERKWIKAHPVLGYEKGAEPRNAEGISENS